MLEVTITLGHSVMGVHRTSKRARAPTSVEYAAAAGVVIEPRGRGESVAEWMTALPAALKRDRAFLCACLAEAPWTFDGHHAWYVQLHELGIEPDALVSHAKACVRQVDAWDAFRMGVVSARDGRGVDALDVGPDHPLLEAIGTYMGEWGGVRAVLELRAFRHVAAAGHRFDWDKHKSWDEWSDEEEERAHRAAEVAGRCV